MSDENYELLRKQINALYRRMRAEQPVVEGLTPSALEVLRTVEKTRSPLRPGQLGREARMTSPNVASTLRILEEHSLISRQNDPGDGRKSYVLITDLGKRLLEGIRRNRPAWLKMAAETYLSEKERRTLVEAGEIMQRLADLEGQNARITVENSQGNAKRTSR